MWSVQTYRKITHWRFTAGQEKPCKGKYIFVFVCVYVCVCCIHRHHEQQTEAQPPYAWTWPAVRSLMQKERKKEQTAPGSLTSCPTLKENTTDFLAFACYFHTTCNFQLPLREAPNLQKNAKLQWSLQNTLKRPLGMWLCLTQLSVLL